MSEIKITRLSDDHDCETCGLSYAEGFEVTIDGESFGDYTPLAHCYAGSSYDLTTVLTDILVHLGHTVEV